MILVANTYTILAGKGTVKHGTLQLTHIRTLCLKMVIFIDNLEVVHHDELVVKNCGSVLQVAALNVRKHFSESLNLSIEFMDNNNSHDAAHELACLVAKVGKIDRQWLVKVLKCELLIELDSVLQHLMAYSH